MYVYVWGYSQAQLTTTVLEVWEGLSWSQESSDNDSEKESMARLRLRLNWDERAVSVDSAQSQIYVQWELASARVVCNLNRQDFKAQPLGGVCGSGASSLGLVFWRLSSSVGFIRAFACTSAVFRQVWSRQDESQCLQVWSHSSLSENSGLGSPGLEWFTALNKGVKVSWCKIARECGLGSEACIVSSRCGEEGAEPEGKSICAGRGATTRILLTRSNVCCCSAGATVSSGATMLERVVLQAEDRRCDPRLLHSILVCPWARHLTPNCSNRLCLRCMNGYYGLMEPCSPCHQFLSGWKTR